MELSHRFTVPIGVEATWAQLNDIASVAECFPGAQVTEADDESFAGSVKVKLGPIALLYTGSGTFVDKDPDAHRFVVDAKGKDKRGNGTAGATVTVSMAEAGGSTEVSVDTDLSITGKPAQFGRGVMQDVSDKLLAQFAACLEQRLAVRGAATALSGAPAATPAAPPAAPSAAPAAPKPPARSEQAAAAVDPDDPTEASAPTEALDLGSTVLPVLVRSYWRHAAAALAALVVLRRLVRR
ncbi:SRPBCC family protein [Nocardioides sp. SYSU D00065]|uniref:SRPBCC family protein n=1 Tax=Nocardioides sp. SYSU D00065 TaxID=2817378 RepID=UPI001B334905|nr:SRPBCC family protein [Nocardioides sp. SYSU D00065]